MNTPDVIVKGRDNGDGMVIHYNTSRGTDVFGLGMPNFHSSGDWDLGPTWCYLICSRKNTLIDTGRSGNIENLRTMLGSIDKSLTDIDRVILTHCHEDHDGNLVEILSLSGARLWAHEIYPRMISYYPGISEGVTHPDFPGSCRMCVMPEEFHEECVPYHKGRSLLQVDFLIKDGQLLPEENMEFVFTPGHTADSVCIILEDEVIFTGDTVLPDITPHPSRASVFQVNRQILPDEYTRENLVYGLMVYIKSLNKIASLEAQPIEATFPAHRLFYNGSFNLTHSSADRAREIIRFHMDRCREILRITGGKPTSLDDIAVQHFDPALLVGGGMELAKVELIAHIEILQDCGDVLWDGEDSEPVQPRESSNYLPVLEAYLH